MSPTDQCPRSGSKKKTMPQISTILQDEQQNAGDRIRLYAEGIFYKAYERSTWVACRVLHPFMVKKRAVRKVGQEVVSIGFPKTSLVKWAGTRRVEHVGDDCVVIYMNDDEALSYGLTINPIGSMSVMSHCEG